MTLTSPADLSAEMRPTAGLTVSVQITMPRSLTTVPRRCRKRFQVHQSQNLSSHPGSSYRTGAILFSITSPWPPLLGPGPSRPSTHTTEEGLMSSPGLSPASGGQPPSPRAPSSPTALCIHVTSVTEDPVPGPRLLPPPGSVPHTPVVFKHP